MNHKEFEDSKIIIRSLLIGFKDGCSLTCFKKEYQKMIGNCLPFNKFGYRSEIEYLKTIPDVVRLSKIGNDVHLMVVPDEKSIHIRKLVCKQKSVKPKFKMPSTASSISFSSSGQKKYVPPPRFQMNFISKKNLSEKLRVEAVDLISKFPTGLKLRDFLVHYRERYKHEFCFKEYGFSTLDECLGLIPQLIVKVKNNESSVMLAAYSNMEHEKKYNLKGKHVLFASNPALAQYHSKRRHRGVSVIGNTRNGCCNTRCPSARRLAMVQEGTGARSEGVTCIWTVANQAVDSTPFCRMMRRLSR
ncbi:tudor domain-containing protein 5 [Trichonephila clavipes]|nr:tudor domain-containing protein 5 [Trichonephila clavipes]